MSENKHFIAGAATARDLAKWLRISRNNVAELVGAKFGMVPPGRKYPWHGVLAHVLGIAAHGAELAALIDAPLMTLAEVAAESGLEPEELKVRIESGSNKMPPMYVFGERCRRFVRPQVLDVLRTGTWRSYASISGHAAPLVAFAEELGIPATRLHTLLEEQEIAEPVHVIEAGEKRYIRAHALTLFSHLETPEAVTPATQGDVVATPPAQGLFAHVLAGVQAGAQ